VGRNYINVAKRERMDTPRQLYHRVDSRLRGLSRLSYAFLSGLVAAVSLLAIGLLILEDVLVWAVPVGVGMAILTYVSNPNKES